MAYFVAILNHDAQTIEYLESWTDLEKANLRAEMLGMQGRFEAETQGKRKSLYGPATSAPSTPAHIAADVASGTYRVRCWDAAGSLIVDETRGDDRDYYIRFTMLQMHARSLGGLARAEGDLHRAIQWLGRHQS